MGQFFVGVEDWQQIDELTINLKTNTSVTTQTFSTGYWQIQSEGKTKYSLPNWFRDIKRRAIKEHFRLKQNEKIRTLMLSKNYLVPTKRTYNEKALSAYFLPVLGLSFGFSEFSLFSCFSFFSRLLLRTTFRYALCV